MSFERSDRTEASSIERERDEMATSKHLGQDDWPSSLLQIQSPSPLVASREH
jgi:hypothetical protein